MHTVATHNEKELNAAKSTPRRPALTVNTNLKKKKWSSLFSSRDKIKFDAPSSNSILPLSTIVKRSATDGNIPKGLEHFDTLSIASSSSDNIDNGSVHSNSSVQNVFKKFHVPHFNIRTHSSQKSDCEYNPVAPEPIMPELVNWSPEAMLSPPPWELQDKILFQPTRNKRHSMGLPHTGSSLAALERYEENDSIETLDDSNITAISTVDYHSDYEISIKDKRASSSSSPVSSSFSPSSDTTLVSSTNRSSTNGRVRRHSSCPSYDSLSVKTNSTASTLVENDIISITEQHTRTTVFKKYTHPVDKKPALKSCQKAKARAAEAAANGTTVQAGNSFVSTFCEDSLKYLYIPNVFDPVTREPVLEFSAVKPRKYQLNRKTSWKREAKALMTWNHALEEYISNSPHEKPKPIPEDKKERYNLTRKFIAREIYVTEVSFWNHLYYTKVIYYDAVCNALEHNHQSIKDTDVDPFANLFDLMQFSAKLINRLRHFQFGPSSIAVKKPIFDSPITTTSADGTCVHGDACGNVRLGKAIREMAEDFVVFLRCALDYRDNRKVLENSINNKGYIRYRQKLRAHKETSQFSMDDFLIIPIQRVARYGLLIADLIKHTEPAHPDYEDLIIAHKIVTSLAFAMNSVQKKKKKN